MPEKQLLMCSFFYLKIRLCVKVVKYATVEVDNKLIINC